LAEETSGRPILAEGCGIFFLEETGLNQAKYLVAFEVEEGSSFRPAVEVMVRTIRPSQGDNAVGNNTFERYLTRLESAISQGGHDNVSDENLVYKPIGVKRSVAISRQSAATMDAYQFSLMETAAGERFLARRESYLSLFPDSNIEDHIDMIRSLCPSIAGIEQALESVSQTD